MRILVTEDHPDLQLELIDYLLMQGFAADGAACLASMNQKLLEHQYQLLLLDLGLPDGDALDLLAALRQQYGLGMGIIIVSARGQPQERVKALTLGADAYLVKPVFLPEMLALINQLAQRLATNSETFWQLNPLKHSLKTPSGVEIALSISETAILACLLEHNGFQTKERLQKTLTPYLEQHYDFSRLDTLICRLRQKVLHTTGTQLPLQTLRNKGYQLTDFLVLATNHQL